MSTSEMPRMKVSLPKKQLYDYSGKYLAILNSRSRKIMVSIAPKIV